METKDIKSTEKIDDIKPTEKIEKIKLITNVTQPVLKMIGVKLHNKLLHPLGNIKRRIHKFMDEEFNNEFRNMMNYHRLFL